MAKKAVSAGGQLVLWFFIMPWSCLVALTPVSSPLLTSAEGHINPTHRAQSCSCSFVVLLVADVMFEEHEGPHSICRAGVRGRSFFGLNVTGLKFGEMLCGLSMIKGFQKESTLLKSHHFPYNVELMRISNTI